MWGLYAEKNDLSDYFEFRFCARVQSDILSEIVLLPFRCLLCDK